MHIKSTNQYYTVTTLHTYVCIVNRVVACINNNNRCNTGKYKHTVDLVKTTTSRVTACLYDDSAGAVTIFYRAPYWNGRDDWFMSCYTTTVVL